MSTKDCHFGVITKLSGKLLDKSFSRNDAFCIRNALYTSELTRQAGVGQKLLSWHRATVGRSGPSGAVSLVVSQLLGACKAHQRMVMPVPLISRSVRVQRFTL